jgi:hypothetical protein
MSNKFVILTNSLVSEQVAGPKLDWKINNFKEL